MPNDDEVGGSAEHRGAGGFEGADGYLDGFRVLRLRMPFFSRYRCGRDDPLCFAQSGEYPFKVYGAGGKTEVLTGKITVKVADQEVKKG